MSLSSNQFPYVTCVFCLFVFGERCDTSTRNPQVSMVDQVAQLGMVENSVHYIGWFAKAPHGL